MQPHIPGGLNPWFSLLILLTLRSSGFDDPPGTSGLLIAECYSVYGVEIRILRSSGWAT